MAFVDEAKIKVAAGDGGDGALAWHHEPYKPKGGPDGGDGGDGGSVILRADPSIGTLLELRDHPHIKAARGGHGLGKRRHGARGEDRVVLVPPGTILFDEDGELLADLAGPGDEVVAAQGGRGGKGNARFATATRRAPDFAEKGEPGERSELRLELRLLADAGLVGFPNAGKSTLIGRISAARPKVGDYPFTTLEPSLGVVQGEGSTFVIADIPGLLAGAHEGKGLGDRFLRHIRRAAVLVFLIDMAAADRDPLEDVETLQGELRAFDPDLAARPSLIIATKSDIAGDVIEGVRSRFPDALIVSAVTGDGIDELVRRLGEQVASARAGQPAPVGYVRHMVRPDRIVVGREENRWRVTGKRAERAVATTDLDNDEAVARLQRRLISIGVERALLDAGATAGDEVWIGDDSFDFQPESEVGQPSESDGDGDGET